MPVTGGEIQAAGPLFALVDDAKVRGGYHSVADAAERDALEGSDFAKLGMMVFVRDVERVYVLTSGGWVLFVGAGGGGGGAGWIKITDVGPQTSEVVSAKVFQDPPYNTILQTAVASAETVAVAVKSSYPLVEVAGQPATLPPSADGGHYEGSVAVTASGVVTAVNFNGDGDAGAVDTMTLSVDAPPQLLSLSFAGTYPGLQTELKAGDTFLVTGTTDVPATHVQIADYGAGTSELIALPGAPTTSFTVAVTIADRGTVAQALPARVAAVNAVGAAGATRDTNAGGGSVDGVDVVTLNNLYPTVAFGAVTYPPTQAALKASESATVAVTTANVDGIAYSSPTGELAITGPSVDEPVKTVTRVSGTYNVSAPNLSAQALRAANDAWTSASTVVAVADAAAVVTVSEPAARLRSGGNDGTAAQDHVITVASDQQLISAPTLSAPAGTWQGAGFAGGPSSWTRALRVHDDDVKGVYAWGALSATNLAGVVTTVISGDANYELGGFVARTLVFDPFAAETLMNVRVTDFSKLAAGVFTATNQPALKQALGTAPVVANGWTIDAVGVKPTTVIWLDTPAANSNSSGTAAITGVEELA